MIAAVITNVVFAAFVLVVIPGMLFWAIRTSRDGDAQHARARRHMPHPHFPHPSLSLSRPSPRRPASGASR